MYSIRLLILCMCITLTELIQDSLSISCVGIVVSTDKNRRPYVHWPTFYSQVQQRLYQSNWGLFITTMAICANGAGHLCDGALMTSDPHPLRTRAPVLSAKCYNAAVKAIPSDTTYVTDHVSLLKAQAILASTCLQNGDLHRATAHLGQYVSTSVSTRFYDEDSWPADLNEIQRQERRRLVCLSDPFLISIISLTQILQYWGVYQQDQYISHKFSYIPRQRESNSNVLYPAEVDDDEHITETTCDLDNERVSFLRGWNFCTDLYFLFEHIGDAIRIRVGHPGDIPGGAISKLLSSFHSPKSFAADSLHLVRQLHDDLPQEVKEVQEMTGDPARDRYGYIGMCFHFTFNLCFFLPVTAGVARHQSDFSPQP